MDEYKFQRSPFKYSDYLNTKAKLTPLKEKARFYYALFSESGFDEKIADEADRNDATLYCLEEILNYK